MEEIWKDIPAYEGIYQASNLGRIRSLDKQVMCRGGNRIAKGRVLVQSFNQRYLNVSLCGWGMKITFRSHRLIWESHRGGIPCSIQINHVDGNPLNNCLTNLETVTASENIIHAHKNGLINVAKGEIRSNLKTSDILQMFKLHGKGLNNSQIAQFFNVKRETVRDILSGKRWRHIKQQYNLVYASPKADPGLLWAAMKCEASRYGFILLSNEYVNARTKYQFKCKCGNEFSCWPQSLKKLKGCHECAAKSYSKSKTITKEQLEATASNIGYKLLDSVIISATHKHKYRCRCGEIVYKKIEQLRVTKGCIKCRRKRVRS